MSYETQDGTLSLSEAIKGTEVRREAIIEWSPRRVAIETERRVITNYGQGRFQDALTSVTTAAN